MDPLGGDPIGQIFANAWNRLKRKQLLFLYPFTVGVLNVLAFLAVYVSLGGTLSWDAFASADYTRWDFIQRNFSQILTPSLAMGVAAVVAVLLCLVLAMIRAPFFRAVAGVGYPLAARSWTTVVKLWLFYLLSYAVLFVVPTAFPVGSTAFDVAGYVVIAIAVIIIFAEYAVVFEDLWPVAAVRRSLHLLRKGWLVVLVVYAASILLWLLVSIIYGAYYEPGRHVFLLLPLSQLLLEAIITTVVDVVLIFTYDSLRGH